ncbi:MAG: NAD+ synthase [Euryarchaeota archaeon]|nr:NAD+ synthase [Euryarchaeota archaeon]
MLLGPKFQESYVDVIVSFLRHHVKESGRRGVVLGMSGGVDSSLVAKLCADAIGPANVVGLFLPEKPGPSQDEKDAASWAKRLGIGFRTIEIGSMVEALARQLRIAPEDRIGLGNVKARVRMIALYQLAHAENRIVIGTGNKSEQLCGYFTKFGDAGCDFLPIGDLYKTQVREMARHLGLPAAIIEKVPTAGLWPEQTDEGDLGIPYDVLDRILLGLELQLHPKEIAEKVDVDLREVERMLRLVEANVHKRKMPLIPKLGIRTLGLDWRE